MKVKGLESRVNLDRNECKDCNGKEREGKTDGSEGGRERRGRKREKQRGREREKGIIQFDSTIRRALLQPPTSEQIYDGHDHTQHDVEVEIPASCCNRPR